MSNQLLRLTWNILIQYFGLCAKIVSSWIISIQIEEIKREYVHKFRATEPYQIFTPE